MVWPSPQGILANRSVFGSSTNSCSAFRSCFTFLTLAFHADALGGASVCGQYPSGHFGETCFGLRLNSRMSHCAMRMCSSSIQSECGNPPGFRPISSAGTPATILRTWHGHCRHEAGQPHAGEAPCPCDLLFSYFVAPFNGCRFNCGSGSIDNIRGLRLRFLSAINSRDASHQAAHGQFAFVIGEEHFADAAAPIIPTLQQG